jgi:hypothetical protein
MDVTLKSLADHNAERHALHAFEHSNAPRRNGLACPTCGEELWDTNPGEILISNPPQKRVHCRNGHRTYRLL